MKRLLFGLGVGVLVALYGTPANASTVTFVLGTQLISNDPGNNTPISGSLPSVGRLTFEDIGPQMVRLTITADLEAANEFFQFLLFNGSFGTDASHPRNQDLDFTQGAKTGTFANPTVSLSNDAQTVNPNGGFDYKITFAVLPGGDRFDGTDSIIYTITCKTGVTHCAAGGYNPLDALDFNVVNLPGATANYNGWYSVVALGYLAPGQTGDSDGARYGDQTAGDNLAAAGGTSATVPEPASWLLLGSGLAALAAVKRRTASRKN